MTSGWRKRGYGRVKPMNTTQTQVRSTDEALSVFDTLKLALEALETHVPHVYKDRGYAPITAIKEALMSLCDGAQQPQNEVRGLSHSNEQSKCNHTKTITRADIDGNQIETTCGECGERVAQQPQDVVRGLLSNEQVEPVAWQERQAKRMSDGVVTEWTNWYPCRYRTIDEARAEACDHIPYEWRPLYTTPPQRTWVGLMRGVRVEGDTVVISVKGGNDAARELCAHLIDEMN